MALSPQETAKMRERIKNLNIDNNPQHRLIYEQERFNYIIAAELSPNMGLCNTAIKDSKGRKAVGIGFDMDRSESRQEWNNAFSGQTQIPDFDAVRNCVKQLTDAQVRILYNSAINRREAHLKAVYQSCWSNLTANERLAIEDLNYNGGDGLVGVKTNFRRNILQYIIAKQQNNIAVQKNLDAALWEVKKNSNKEQSKGLQNRRDSQAEMLNSYNRNLNTLPIPDYVSGNITPAQPAKPFIAPKPQPAATITKPKPVDNGKVLTDKEREIQEEIRRFEEGMVNFHM